MKFALKYLDPYSLVWVRFSFAFIFLLLFFLWKKKDPFLVFKKTSRLSLLAALALGFNYYGYLKGVQLTGPSNAQVIIQLGPLLLAFLGIFFFKEKINKYQGVGILILVFGFFLFYKDRIQNLVGVDLNLFTGSLWVFAGAISWAVFAISQKFLVRSQAPQDINLFIYFFCMILYTPLVNFRVFLDFNIWVWLLLILLGLNTLFAYGLIGEALKRIAANQVGVIITINPLITITVMGLMEFFGSSFLGPDNLGLFGYFGALIFIFGAVIFIYFGGKNEKFSPSESEVVEI